MRNLVIAIVALCSVAHSMPIYEELPGWARDGFEQLPGWGRDGHMITAALAQIMLTPTAASHCMNLLPSNDGQLIQVANWADSVKSEPAYRWSAPLHFINTPDWLCTYVRSRDCVLNGVPNFCADGAIQNYTKRVVDNSLSADQRAEALKFLVHFIGDIHQPLHVGFTTDKGGNTITGTYEGHSGNLHAVWDTSIIVQRMKADFNGNQTAYIEYLAQQINSTWAGNAPKWEQCATPNPTGACSDEWAVESIGAACTYAYVEADGKTHITTPFNLGDPYYNRNLPVIEMQLAKAGVRMANVINSLFTHFL